MGKRGGLVGAAVSSFPEELGVAITNAEDVGMASLPCVAGGSDAPSVKASNIGITPSFAYRLRKTRDVLSMTFAARGSSWDGDDVIQDVLIALARQAPALEHWPQQRLERYAKRAFLWRLSNARRHEQRSRIRDGEWAYGQDSEIEIQTAERVITGVRSGTLCESLLAHLPEDLREVVVARELEGLTILETAAALGIGQGAVRFRLRLGRSMLRKLGAQIAGGSRSGHR